MKPNYLVGIIAFTFFLAGSACASNFSGLTAIHGTGALSVFTDVTLEHCEQMDGTATAYASGGVTPYSYLWDANAANQTTTTATGLSSGTYAVTVSDSGGDTLVRTAKVDSTDGPSIISTVTNETCEGDNDGMISLFVSGVGPLVYYWSNDSTSDTLAGIPAGIYTLTVTDFFSCSTVDTFTVGLDNTSCIEDLNIPSAFTPNSDGVNDDWIIRGWENFSGFKVDIYNRWGSLLFSSSPGYSKPWDGTHNGKALPSAAYYYAIDLGNGETRTGTITIVK